MAEFAKEDLDAIVQAIGFGIVSDFRSLQSAMRTLADQSQENNRLLGDINQNLSSTDRSLERLEKDIYRQIDARQFGRLENEMEKKSKASSRKADQILNDVQKSLDNLRREATSGNRQQSSDRDREDVGDNKPAPSSDAEIGQFLEKVASTGGGGGSNLALPSPSGGGGAAMVGAGLLGAAMIGGGAALMMNRSSSPVGALAPAETATPQTPSISAAPNNGSATQAPTASTTGAVSAATQAVSSVTTSSRRKALEKITNKMPGWVNKNSDKVLAVLGGKQNAKIFGQLTGGTFTFSKYMTDDSWTGLGEEYVMGTSLAPAQTKNQNAAYVAGVVVNLAILAYLACRDIYTQENYRDISNGVIPNFDDLGSSEKFQFVKNAGSQIENYLNKLISESTASGRTGAASSSAGSMFISSAEAATPPPSADLSASQSQQQQQIDTGDEGHGGGSGATNPATTGSSPNQSAASGGGGPTGSGSAAAAAGTAAASTAAGQSFTGSGGLQQASQAADTGGDVTGGSNIASFDMSDSVTSDITGNGSASSEWSPVLDYIADSEGADYNTQYANQQTTNKPLTSLTVAEIMKEQKKQKGSSAIGRYQFMAATMKDAVNKGIIKPDEQFSPEMQDRLATWLIENKRNGRAWKSGRISDEKFGLGLAQEWASVPSPYTGKGYYSGQNAKYGVDTLMQVIQSSKQSTVQQGPGEENSTETIPAAAKGAIITPLPKSPTDTINLAPSRMEAGSSSDDEDDFTSSSNPIDARPKSYSTNPYDEVKNKIASYNDYMQYHFGYLTEEFDLHTSGELTAEEAYKRAMNPLGR